MKILFVTTSHNQISETFIRNKIKGLMSKKCKIEILTHDKDKVKAKNFHSDLKNKLFSCYINLLGCYFIFIKQYFFIFKIILCTKRN